MDDFEKRVAAAAQVVMQRPMYWFTVPPKEAAQIGISRVGMVELTSNEEIMAAKRAQVPAMLAYEYALEAFRFADESPLSTANGSANVMWEKIGAHGRFFLVNAYNKVHVPKDEDMQSFLESMTVAVG